MDEKCDEVFDIQKPFGQAEAFIEGMVQAAKVSSTPLAPLPARTSI